MTARHAAAAPEAVAFSTSLKIAAAAAIGILAAACGTQAATGQQSPPKLRLSGIPGASSSQQAGSPRSGVQPGGPASGGPSSWARVEVPGGLPASGPSAGTVRQLPGGPAPRSEVLTLAAALHLTGSPQRPGSGWRVTGPGTLQVSGGPGLRWTYTGRPVQPCGGPIMKYATAERHGPAPGPIELTAWACPQAGPATGTARGPATGTARASGRGPRSGAGSLEPSDPIPGRSGELGPPSPQAAESVAVPVLRAAGVTGSPLHASVGGTVTSVSADPSIRGLPTAGFSTVVQVGPSGVIEKASGWLSRPVPGATYPLVGAGQAVRSLGAAASGPLPGGGNPPPLRVTGAAYGLALGYDGTGAAARPLLVPAWLFHVAGSATPVPAVAISPRYLASR